MEIAALIASIASLVIAILIYIKLQSVQPDRGHRVIDERLRTFREDLSQSQSVLNARIDSATRETNTTLMQAIASLNGTVNDSLTLSRKELQENLQNVSETLHRRFESLQQSNEHRLEQIRTNVESKLTESVDKSFTAVKDITQQLGDLKVSQERLVEIGKDINTLTDILQSPKLRGNFGEFELESLLRQVIPSEQLRMQCPVSDGLIVDAAIQLKQGLLCIDSKFPQAAYTRLVEPNLTDDDRARLGREFERTVRDHVNSISDKYIVPGKTIDFAFMFVAAENVYYEILTRPALQEYARSRRIVPVSPNSLYAYLAVIAIGFKGMQLEQHAERIGRVVSGLRVNFERFKRDVELIATHLDRARTKLDETQRDIRRLDDTVSALELPDASKETCEDTPKTSKTPSEVEGPKTPSEVEGNGDVERTSDIAVTI